MICHGNLFLHSSIKEQFCKGRCERRSRNYDDSPKCQQPSNQYGVGDFEKVLSMVQVILEEALCGCVFRISAKSFYQINPVQTEVLYDKAIALAGLTERKRFDAYCGTGTIGLIAKTWRGPCNRRGINRDAVPAMRFPMQA